jgi:DNA-binding CsgD family transcriptional regulator
VEVSGAPTRLFGRGQEQQRIDGLIGAARSRGSGALLVRGEVGTGKSSLLAYAVARAVDMGLLRCQCDRAESDLPFAAVHQLLGHVLSLVDQLPERLGAPLAQALALRDGGGQPDRFLVCSAILALLALAARERPLLCVVDDAQWLDGPSADALSFAARRLNGEGIVLLVAVRDGEGRPFEAAGVAEARLRGLDARAAASMLAERAGPELVPEVAALVVERTSGLPLALADAASTLTAAQLAGRVPLPEPLPMGLRLRDAFLARVRRLPEPTRRMLLLVAAAGLERLHVVIAAASDLRIEVSALEAAETAGLVRIDQAMVSIADPLIHSAVYSDATFFLRRDAHLALARALTEDDDDRHAWHLAAAALSRDGALAAELERLADRAGQRGNLAARAAALQHAAELTPDGPERGRRLAAAASAQWLAGRSVRAGEMLSRADRLRPGPLLQAEIAELRGAIELGGYDLERAREALARGAETAAELGPGRATDLLLQAAEVAAVGSDAAAAGGLARSAEALATASTRNAAQLLRRIERVLRGELGESAPLAEQVIWMARGAERDAGRVLGLATALSAGNDLAPDALACVLSLLGSEVGRRRAAGEVGVLPGALASLAWVEFWADRHRSGLANASEGLSRARALGLRWVESSAAMTLAMVAAVRGNEDECRALADLLLNPPGVQSAAFHAGAATWATALSHLGAGRFAEALAGLEELEPGRPLGQPWHTLWSRPDAVEAAVRCGQPEAARAALEILEGAARPDWPAPAAALLERCRALATEGREAERHYLAALALHAENDRPFQHARTRLLWAEHLRRHRRRVDAREQLRAALDLFDRLDARPWSARAHAELRASGETLHRAPTDGDELTPQEIRIAYLVAQGGSNREVAQQLYLSPRTVGYHLAKIYRKLGVSSRTRLAHLLLEDQTEDQGEQKRRSRAGLAGRARAAFRRLGLPPQR